MVGGTKFKVSLLSSSIIVARIVVSCSCNISCSVYLLTFNLLSSSTLLFYSLVDTMNQAAKMAPVLKQSKSTIISISGPPTIEAIQSTQKDPTASPPLLIRFFMFLMRNRAAEKAARSKDCTWEFIFMKASGEDLDTLGGYFEKGEMEVVIDTVGNGLEDYEAPVEKLCSGRAKGKCVIKVV